jgi:carbon starvation protein
MPGVLGTSAVIVLAWGYFLYQGVVRPVGRHQFAVAPVWNRESVAGCRGLCVGTTILVKMHGARYMWVTCVPLVWLVVVVLHGWMAEDFFRPSPR